MKKKIFNIILALSVSIIVILRIKQYQTDQAALGIIGGSDGPTVMFLASKGSPVFPVVTTAILVGVMVVTIVFMKKK